MQLSCQNAGKAYSRSKICWAVYSSQKIVCACFCLLSGSASKMWWSFYLRTWHNMFGIWVNCMQVCLSLSCLTEDTVLNIECPVNCKEAYKGKLNEDVNNLCWQAKGVSKLHCGLEDVTIKELSIAKRCNITFGPCSKMWLNFTVWGLPAKTDSLLSFLQRKSSVLACNSWINVQGL